MHEVTDGSQLLGAELNGGTYSTTIDGGHSIQLAYHFLKPVSEYRSIDGAKNNILSWKPETDSYHRHREWRENGFSVPKDVTLSEDTVGLLSAVRGVSREVADDGEMLEIYLPPMTRQDLRPIKQELAVEHGIVAIAGEGRAPLLIADKDSVETIHSFENKW